MASMWRHTNEGFIAHAIPAHGDMSQGGPAFSRADGVCVFSCGCGNRPSHILLASNTRSVRVNGSRLLGGIRVLQHKDELLVDTERMFFSAESIPVVEDYQHDTSSRRPRCPTCRAEILDRQSIVRCPGCSRIYHQIDATGDAPAKPCWTYSPACRFCQHPSSMSGEPTWRPAEEGP